MAPTKKRKKKSRSSSAPRGNPQRAKAVAAPRRAGIGEWIGGARLRTLPLAVTPVIIGTGAAQIVDRHLHWVLALGCLAVAVFLQIAVNFANDYSDGVRGTDAYRTGPARLTGSGAAAPRTVLIVALVFFALAALAGLALVVRTQHWWMIAVGAVCILAAWFYTGGKRPYGYAGLGELVVFVFFGLVATAGSTFIQVGFVPQESWFGAVAAGLFACAVLVANNLRDIPQDRLAGKRTLSARIGPRASQALYTVLVVLPFGISVFLALFYTGAWLSLLALLLIGPALLIVWLYEKPQELVIALSLTSLGSLGYAVLLYAAFTL